MEIFSQSEENYIKAIFYLQEASGESVGTNDLASRMDTKASSVTDMIKRLSDKSIIVYEKYMGCKLTPKGKQIALKIIRKHRLWETFLVEKLKFGWEEVHEIAEQLEHIHSSKLTDRLDEFLDFPEFDPHGDPIPTKNGEINHRKEALMLRDLEKGAEAIIIGVSDSSVSFLKYLDKHNIQLGSKIKILEHFEFDESIEVSIDGREINLSSLAVSKIRVQAK